MENEHLQLVGTDKYLEQGPIKLEIFRDDHIDELTKIAQNPTIWQSHRNHFDDPHIFKTVGIESAKQAIANKTRYMFVVYYQNQIIGSTSYYDVSLNHLKMHIGYTWFQPEFWGKGINTTVKQLMLTYAFDQLHFKRVAFCIDAENLRSRKAVEKLGASFEGILKKHQIRPDGTSRDSAIYAITDEQWLASKVKKD